MSVPARIDGFNGPADSSPGHTRAGRRFANSFSSRLIPSNAASGLADDGPLSNAGSPTAPRRMPSACRARFNVSSGSGGSPWRRAAAPMGASEISKVWPKRAATVSRTRRAAAVTSGPMPSPGRSRIENLLKSHRGTFVPRTPVHASASAKATARPRRSAPREGGRSRGPSRPTPLAWLARGARSHLKLMGVRRRGRSRSRPVWSRNPARRRRRRRPAPVCRAARRRSP
jgi:hypothetical protein